MPVNSTMTRTLTRHPLTWLPFVASLSALILLIIYVAFFGVNHEPGQDEGAAARLFQLLMLISTVLMGVGLIRNLMTSAVAAFWIVLLQVFSWTPALALLWWFEHPG